MVPASFFNWNKNNRIQLIESNRIKKVLADGSPYMIWAINDECTQRMAIIQLYKSKICK